MVQLFGYKFFAVGIYFFATIISIYYLIFKFKNKKYILSMFNLNIFIYLFSYFIISLFAFSSQSWESMYIIYNEYLDKYIYQSISINGLGLIVFLLCLIFLEFKKKNGIKIKQFNVFAFSKSFSPFVIDFLFIIIIIVWHYIVLTNNSFTYPIFNKQRFFYYQKSFSPIYLGLNILIQVYSVYYGVVFVQRKKKVLLFVLALLSNICTGSRSNLFVNTLYPILTFCIYQKVYNKISLKKSTKKVMFICFLLLFLGIVYLNIRDAGTSKTTIIESIIYGNNFSDIRDGAFILFNLPTSRISGIYGGKTVLAGLLSFIPSSISQFRNLWSWGRITTSSFAIGVHGGLRGGNVMEAFLNFGFFGIIIFSFFQAFFMSILEKNFCDKVIYKKNYFDERHIFSFYLIYYLYTQFICTSGFYNLYTIFVFYIFLLILSILIKNIYKRRRL